jgi:hypothetical protein
LHCPQIKHHRWGDAKTDEVGQGVELGAKLAGSFKDTGDTTVQSIKDRGGEDRKD